MNVSGEELLSHLTDAAHQVARRGTGMSLSASIPTCPGWTTSDLLRHLCAVHAKAAHLVRGRPPEALAVADVSDDRLITAFIDGVETLVKSLQSARASAAASVTTGRQFWTRRMAHETTVHALDLEVAADSGMVWIPENIAADGLEELALEIAPSAFSTAGMTAAIGAAPCLITLMPLDVNRAWTLSLSADGVRSAAVASDHATLTVAGMSSDLYRWAWNRAPDDVVSLSGDHRLADLWHTNFKVIGRASNESRP